MLRSWQAHQSHSVIRSGGIIAYPTEAVYGLGVDPGNPVAIGKLLRLKQRPVSKGLIVVAAHPGQITHYIKNTPAIDWTAVEATWPGPVTWVFPASRQVPAWLIGGKRSIAIRISDHPLVQSLCRRCGPLVSTSANPGARRPARSALQVRCYFPGQVDLVLPGALGGRQKPTEIRDAITGMVLREG